MILGTLLFHKKYQGSKEGLSQPLVSVVCIDHSTLGSTQPLKGLLGATNARLRLARGY